MIIKEYSLKLGNNIILIKELNYSVLQKFWWCKVIVQNVMYGV